MARTFKASPELVTLLLKYGFSDNTEKLYPKHFKQMKERGYDPHSMKRIFCFRQHEDYLLFNYVYITLHHNGAFSHTEERKTLTTDELRSLITFYKLPPQGGKEWLEAYTNALDLYKYYRNARAMPEVYNTELDKRITSTFERVILH
jgi:hypothetical protein